MDFSLDLLNTKVSCTAPPADDFNLENLISGEKAARSKGFLTEGFVRPPVNVDFTFRAPIDIFHIFFDTKVFTKQCCAFAVYFNCHPSDDSSFVRVGVFNTKNEDHIHLVSASLNTWHQYPIEKKNARKLSPGDVFEGRLRSFTKSALRNVRRLRIRLLKNISTGGSGLKNLEVWGKVGDLAASKDREILLKSWQDYLHSLERKEESNSQKCLPPEVTPLRVSEVDHHEDFPEEFLDPITWDVMVTPMLLPSGHSVDITTLDKFNVAEMRYNRPPSNPFTGIAFTKDQKPVPNTALKSRIDRFILLRERDGEVTNQTSAKFPSSGNTLASSRSSKSNDSNTSIAKESNILNTECLTALRTSIPTHENKKAKISDDSTNKETFRGFSIINGTSSNSSSASSTDTLNQFRGHRGLPQQISARPSRAAIPKKHSIIGTQSSNKHVPISRDLLHSKPSKIIQGDSLRPEFHAYSSKNLLQSADKCCKCTSLEQLYSIATCKHLLCRQCLSGHTPSSIVCPRCHVVVDSSSISKHNALSLVGNA